MLARPADTILLGERHNSDVKTHGGPGNGVYYSPPFNGVSWMDSWLGQGEVPDGDQPGSNAWPNGPNGAVTARHGDRANFAFCDGHVKSMLPIQTDPSQGSMPDKNMWDASRQ